MCAQNFLVQAMPYAAVQLLGRPKEWTSDRPSANRCYFSISFDTYGAATPTPSAGYPLQMRSPPYPSTNEVFCSGNH